jgi:fermentation-respiration switch protein FrsA (DUF1100 family)
VVRVRRVIWSIVLGLPLSGIGCAGAPEADDETTPDLGAIRAEANAATQPTASPPAEAPEDFVAQADPRTPGLGGNAIQFTTVKPAGAPGSPNATAPGTVLPGTVSRASVFGRPAAHATDTVESDPRPGPSNVGGPPDERIPPAVAPAPTSPTRPAGLLRRLLGPSISSASPSPAADQSSSSSRSTERQRLHEKLLFYPTRHPDGLWTPEAYGAEDVTFTSSDGKKLHGWFVPCESPRAYVLYAHGNGGNLSYNGDVYRKLHELGVAVFAFDYRGYGRSEGKPTVTGVVDDARAARAWLAKRGNVPEAAVVLMGRSLGGAVVVQLAGELPPRGLILESTFSSLREVADHHFSKLSWLVPRDELNSAAVLAAYRGPLFASHGDADRTIPPAQGKKLYEAARGPKQFFNIAGADHNDPLLDSYYRRLDQFFAGLPGE